MRFLRINLILIILFAISNRDEIISFYFRMVHLILLPKCTRFIEQSFLIILSLL